jgi:hypothetical protein
LAAIHADQGYVEILGGDLQIASEHGRRAIELAERADAPAWLMDALLSTASAEFMLGLDTAALLSRAAAVEGRILGRRPFSSLLTCVGNTLGAQRVSGDIVEVVDLERTYRDRVDRGLARSVETLVFLSELESRAGAFDLLSSTPRSRRGTVEAGYDQAREAVGLSASRNTPRASSLLGAMRPRGSRSPSNTATCPT